MNILFFLKPKSELAYIYDYHTLRQALEIMERHKYASVPVLAKDGKYVGSITEGDLLWYLKDNDVLDVKEAESIGVMSIPRHRSYDCVRVDSDMEDLITKSLNQNFVPVIDDRDNFIGIVTRKDLILYYYNNMEDAGR